MNKFVIFVLCLLILQGCKKDDPEPDNYLIAKINGKTWVANVPNSEKANVGATIAQNLVAVVAAQDADNANTTLGIVFPENITTGQEIELNYAQQAIVAYAVSDTEGYLADVSSGGSGKLVVSRLDKENQIVEGTFFGTAVNTRNGNKLEITDGKFRSKIYEGSVTTTNPGKK